ARIAGCRATGRLRLVRFNISRAGAADNGRSRGRALGVLPSPGGCPCRLSPRRWLQHSWLARRTVLLWTRSSAWSASAMGGVRAERDEIFKLESGGGEHFILKLTSALEEPLRTDFLTQALLHVTQKDATLPTPRLIMTRDGHAAFKAPWGHEAAPTVRLFSY